jgi:dTDP-4-dehydrorhamnose 3,5-epimerase-like enzyme
MAREKKIIVCEECLNDTATKLDEKELYFVKRNGYYSIACEKCIKKNDLEIHKPYKKPRKPRKPKAINS